MAVVRELEQSVVLLEGKVVDDKVLLQLFEMRAVLLGAVAQQPQGDFTLLDSELAILELHLESAADLATLLKLFSTAG